MTASRHLLAGLLIFISGFAAHAEDPISIGGATSAYSLGARISFLKDETGRLTIEEVNSPKMQSSFIRSHADATNFSYTHATIWVRLQIHNMDTQEDWWLEVGQPRLQRVSLYEQRAGIWHRTSSGSALEFSMRPLQHRTILFPLKIRPGETHTYYLEIRSSTAIDIPVRLWTPAAFLKGDSHQSLLQEGVYGVLLGLALFFFLSAPIMRSTENSQFALTLICLTIYSAAYNGFIQMYFHSLSGDWAVRIIALSAAFAEFFFIAFSRNFLQTRRIAPNADRVLVALMVVSVMVMGLSVWSEYSIAGQAISVLALGVGLTLLWAAISVYSRGFIAARFYLLATVLYWLVEIMRVCRILGLTSFSLTETESLIASIGLVPLLAVAFADRFERLRQDKEKAHAELLTIERQHVGELEGKVAERTKEFKEAKERAELASRAKGDFLAAMSHELRTPMTTILGAVTLLATARLGRDHEKLLHSIRSAGNHLGALIDDVLDLSRIEKGRVGIRQEEFNPEDVLQDAVAMLRDKAKKRGNTLSLKTHRLPHSALGDPGRIRQIVINLITNAIRYTEHGVISVRGEAQLQDGGRTSLKICVRDTGIGIPEEHQTIIFSPFERADDVGDGVGLGLAICQRLVQVLRGTIGVQSAPGQGSLFWFTVPLVIVQDASTQLLRHNTSPGPYEILLVEDHDTNRDILGRLLRSEAHQVTAVANGNAAIDTATRHRFDFILMDLQLPDIDGLEATRQIRNLAEPAQADIPIFALTAWATVEMIERCHSAGMNGVVAKPLRLSSLYAAIEGSITNPIKEEDQDVLFDSSLWERYRHLLSTEELNELITSHLNSIEADQEALYAAHSNENFEDLAYIAHRITSSVGIVGFIALSDIARQIEDCARQGIMDKLDELLEEFRLTLAETLKEFEPMMTQ